MHVVMCLTLIDIHVTGILLDAAGNNRRFVRYLLGGATKVAGSWIESPFCTNVFLGLCNFIYVWYCSTHNLKSLRNALLCCNGSKKAARVFHDKKDVYFGWSGVKDQWEREEIRKAKKSLH